jgi:predicted GIY-YIG superfamily endonuclease
MPVYLLYVRQSETTGRFYIGHTQDVRERLAYHNANYPKSLKNGGPRRLVPEQSSVYPKPLPKLSIQLPPALTKR